MRRTFSKWVTALQGGEIQMPISLRRHNGQLRFGRSSFHPWTGSDLTVDMRHAPNLYHLQHKTQKILQINPQRVFMVPQIMIYQLYVQDPAHEDQYQGGPFMLSHLIAVSLMKVLQGITFFWFLTVLLLSKATSVVKSGNEWMEGSTQVGKSRTLSNNLISVST